MKYDSYKDSGVEWIGEIPSHWEVKRGKYLFDIVSGYSPENIENLINEVGIPYFKVNDLNDQAEIFNLEKSNLLVSDLGINKFPIGTVLFPKRGAAISTNKVKISLKDCVFDTNIMGLIPYKDKIHERFLAYSLLNRGLWDIADTSTIPQINNKHIEPLEFVLPNTIEEQTTIANYLDQKTTQIDDLIAKKERLIQLLEEERVAVINQAVTKGLPAKERVKAGLDPTVPMKDSGIEWLGEIPAHWEVKKLKLLANIQGRIGFKGYTVGDLVSEGEGALTLGAKHIDKFNRLNLSNPEFISWDKYYESPEIMVQIGDIILTQRGTLGKVVLITEDLGEATINPSMVILSKLKANEYFLYYFFNSDYFKSWIDLTNTATAVPMISQAQLGNLKLVLPNIDEQNKIVTSIQKSTKKIDDIIVKAQQEIELLKEYKTALINEVVTGKLDVRGEK